MKNIRDMINEKMMNGFFGNMGVSVRNPKEWFNTIAVRFEQYLTKWDDKHIKKDVNNYTITFPNLYKKNNKEQEVILDLSPYMDELVKYDPMHILITFETALWDCKKEIKINNMDRYNEENAPDNYTYHDWQKKIRIDITYTAGENPAPEKDILNGREVNKMEQYTNHVWGNGQSYAQHAAAHRKKQVTLLQLAQYCRDFPFKKDGWTEVYKDFKQI